MEMSFRLVQEQQLQLTITPELRQAIRLLHYPALDLIPYLEEVAQKNPLLDIEEPELLKGLVKRALPSWEEMADDLGGEPTQAEEYVNPIDFFAEREVTLLQHVLEQIDYLPVSHHERHILRYMAGNLDENGYLEIDYEQLSPPPCSRATWQRCLDLLQQLEPYGIGARTLEECLLIQLRHSPYAGDLLCAQLIEKHLKEIAAKRYTLLAKKLGSTVEEIKERVSWIQTFLPKPGSLFLSTKPKYIVPDVFVERLPDSTLVCQANDGILPRIHFNHEYAAMLAENRQALKFIEQKRREYEWLKRSIQKRKETIVRVTEVIVERQRAFFEQGEAALQPLTLKEVAHCLDLHESTVSRAVNQKYMQTPRGLFELKYFFSQGIAKRDGSYTSDVQVKEQIKQLVAAEDKRKPLSDQKIALILQGIGIQIARRTVAKYRQELGILPTSQRRQV